MLTKDININIASAKTREIGDDMILVYDIQNAYRIRIGECGNNAI